MKVVDQDSTDGVKSQVMMSRAKEKEKLVEVDRTDDKGELAFKYTCTLGDQLFAEPLDGSYYQSEKETCKQSVLLRVKKRQLPEDELVARRRAVIVVEYSDGPPKEYIAEYDGIMNGREVTVGGREGEFCYTELTFRLDRDVYLLEEDGFWLKDDSESSSEALIRNRTKTRPWASCARPSRPMYRKVENLGKERLSAELNEDLQGLLSRLQEMEGVESVRLR